MTSFQFDRNIHFENNIPKCPLCSSDANVYRRKDADVFEGDCDSCGGYIWIPIEAADLARRSGKAHLVSAWLRQQPRSSDARRLNPTSIESILVNTREPSVLEKLDLTLITLEKMTSRPGSRSNFRYAKDFSLLYASDGAEALYYIRELSRIGYVEEDSGQAKLTANGYQRIIELSRTGAQSPRVFVAMWFDNQMDEIFEHAIFPAIVDSGYTPVRVDRIEHVNRIDDEIIAQIRRSRFMVADFTGQRAGVYFEAGFIGGLGRTVIWMCRKDDLRNLHFDTRQFNFIDYADANEARVRLYNRIVSIEGEGPLQEGTKNK